MFKKILLMTCKTFVLTVFLFFTVVNLRVVSSNNDANFELLGLKFSMIQPGWATTTGCYFCDATDHCLSQIAGGTGMVNCDRYFAPLEGKYYCIVSGGSCTPPPQP